jgi:predicted RNase H-like nuclease
VVDGDLVQIFSVTLDRIYKDGDEWKYSRNFRIEDLPKIVFAVEEIYKSSRLETKDITEDVNNVSPETLTGEESTGMDGDI